MSYTNGLDDPSAYFYAYAFSKSSGTGSVTFDANSDLQPDFLWVKSRSNADSHELWDSTRGVNSTLFSDSTSAQDTAANRIVSFDTDGFTWGNAGNLNAAGDFVSWGWKANGGTTVSNTDGDLRSVTVQANQDAGFSIVRFLGGTTPYTAGHGLGVAPDVIISKRLGATVGWYVYHKDVGAGKYLQLNSTAAAVTSATVAFTSAPTSTIFTGGTGIGGATDYYINYCFAEKQGYSKFGSYVGNGNDNGPFIYTGFKPAFVLTKGTNVSQWRLYDSARSPNNVNINRLFPYSSSAEATDTDAGIDMLSNGFKIRGSGGDYNASGTTYIYMAFADNPLVTSTGIPTTAR